MLKSGSATPSLTLVDSATNRLELVTLTAMVWLIRWRSVFPAVTPKPIHKT